MCNWVANQQSHIQSFPILCQVKEICEWVFIFFPWMSNLTFTWLISHERGYCNGNFFVYALGMAPQTKFEHVLPPISTKICTHFRKILIWFVLDKLLEKPKHLVAEILNVKVQEISNFGNNFLSYFLHFARNVSQKLPCSISFHKMYRFPYLSQTMKMLHLIREGHVQNFFKNLKFPMTIKGLKWCGPHKIVIFFFFNLI